MIQLLKSEFFRIRKEASFFIIMAILAVYAFINVALYAFIESVASSIDFGESTVDFVYPVGQLMISMAGIGALGIFTALAVGLFNGKDFKFNTIRNKITAGCSRETIFFSSFIVNQMMNAALFVVCELVVLIFGSFMMDWEFTAMFGVDLLMTFMISVAFTAMMTFFSFVSKKTSTTILIGILLAVLGSGLFDLITTFYLNFYFEYVWRGSAPAYGALEFISRINIFSMNTFIVNMESIDFYLNGMLDSYNMYVGLLYGNVAIVSLVWGGASAAGGMLLFRRADIK